MTYITDFDKDFLEEYLLVLQGMGIHTTKGSFEQDIYTITTEGYTHVSPDGCRDYINAAWNLEDFDTLGLTEITREALQKYKYEQRIAEVSAKQKARATVKRVPKKQVTPCEVLGSVVMAKEGSEYFHNKMCVMYIPTVDRHYWVNYNSNIPEADWVLGNKISMDWTTMMIDNDTADVIIEALEMWKEHQGSHLTGFTFLVAYCLAQGVDLFKMNLVGR